MKKLSVIRVGKALVAYLLIGTAAASIRSQDVQSSTQSTESFVSGQVRAIIDRCLARDHSVVNAQTPSGQVVSGITRISWVEPRAQDFQEMLSLGPSAVAPLSLFLDDKRSFAQLLAVKFLTAVGGPTVYDPLVHATSKDKWQVTRLSAMDGLASSPSVEKLIVIEALQTDEDPLVAKKAREIVDRMTQYNSKH